MKVFVVLIYVALVAYVAAEDCPRNNVAQECTHMTCSAKFHKECVKSVCTCTADGLSCSSQAMCLSDAPAAGLHCDHNRWHCVDNLCRCGGRFTWGDN